MSLDFAYFYALIKIQMNIVQKPVFCLMLAAGLFSAGCSQENKDAENANGITTDSTAANTSGGTSSLTEPAVADTISISGRYVVFFGPSESVIEILKEKEPGRNVTQEMQSFTDAMNPVMDSLKKAGFDVQYTEKRYIKVSLRTGSEMKIDRFKLKSEFGMYMTDGFQPPAIKLGQLSTPEMHITLKNFFKP
jgi:hypothetical protein